MSSSEFCMILWPTLLGPSEQYVYNNCLKRCGTIQCLTYLQHMKLKVHSSRTYTYNHACSHTLEYKQLTVGAHQHLILRQIIYCCSIALWRRKHHNCHAWFCAFCIRSNLSVIFKNTAVASSPKAEHFLLNIFSFWQFPQICYNSWMRKIL